MPVQIKQPVRRQVQDSKPSGQNKGAILGALAAGGAVAATGGAAAPVLGAAGAGAGLGGIIGGQAQPAQQGQVTETQIQAVPTSRVADASRQLLDGIRALNDFPSLAEKYAKPLTQAYLSSQMELKRRS